MAFDMQMGSTSKRPITKLQNKEELESVLRKSKKEKKKRRLVKDGKVFHEKAVPPELVVNVDDESKRESKELRKVEGDKSGRKEREKVVEHSCENEAEEFVEKISRKSIDKGKSVRKSVKRKAGDSE
uniref:Uncharacterized protein n=1 Tax=Nicotiana tabacum TaxID=4097 RepID=A0A1S3YYF9_TOBAC|nr:PREDICTED: uncharacterized protein LOC107781041 [Nicotiana tabacum]